MVKTRLGVLPIRIETGRYERPKKPADQRLCQQCSLGSVENEIHFLLECPRNTLLRDKLLSQISNEDFYSYTPIEKLKYLLNSSEIVKITSQY